MQRSVQHTTLQGAQQSQSRSALVSQRFAGNQACFCSCLLPVFCFLGVPRVLGCRHDAGECESGSIRKVLSTQLLPCSVGYDSGVGVSRTPRWQGSSDREKPWQHPPLQWRHPSCRTARRASHSRISPAERGAAFAFEDTWRAEFGHRASA